MSTASSKITDHLRPLLRSQTACGLAIVAFLTVGWFAWQTYGQVALAFTAVAGLGFAIAVFRYPILGLAIATFLLTSHLERYLPKVQTPLLAFVILSVIFWKLFNKDLSFRFVPLLLWAVLFFTWEWLTLLWAITDNPWYPVDVLHFARLLLVILAVTWTINTPRQFQFIILVGILGAALSATLTIHSFFTLVSTGPSSVAGTPTAMVRFSGVWEDPNIMADSLIPFIGLGLILFRTKGYWLKRIIGILAVLLGLAAVAMSLSRGGAITAFLLLLMLVWAERHRWRVLVAGAALLAIVLLLVPADIIGRVGSITEGRRDASINQRTQIFWGGLLMGWDHFPFGVGLMNIGTFSMYYVPSLDHGMVAHEAYVDTFAESGPIGLFLFIGTLCSVLPQIRVRKWRLRSQDLGYNLAIGMTAVWAGILLAEAHYSFSHYVFIYFVLALMSLRSVVYGSTLSASEGVVSPLPDLLNPAAG